MSPEVYNAFESIFSKFPVTGPVLEVGAYGGPESLLSLRSLEKAHPKIGINLDEEITQVDQEIIFGNGNDMHMFETGYFSAVVCNSTLEHDPYFWKTISEIHRVTAPGGIIAIGVPGYAEMGVNTFAGGKRTVKKLLHYLLKITGSSILSAGSVTLGIHNYPGDYYRFSEQAVRKIFLDGLTACEVHRVMHPPRFIGVGFKP
jgi:SAM-dependent methyltransferase